MMKEEICCPAMEHAITAGYVTRPITYNGKKEQSRLTPIIHHPDRESGLPAFLLARCPWCGVDVRVNARTELPTSTGTTLLAAAKSICRAWNEGFDWDDIGRMIDGDLRAAIIQTETSGGNQ